MIADWELDIAKLLDKDNLFFDGIYKNKDCENIDKNKWTYNQGVFMKGYLALSEFFDDPRYSNVVFKTIISMAKKNGSSIN